MLKESSVMPQEVDYLQTFLFLNKTQFFMLI